MVNKKLAEENKFKSSDIIYGLIVPLIVGIVIVIFPAVIGPALNSAFPMESSLAFIPQIFTHGFALMVMFGIPILLGLIWNKWAGGAAGFLCGTLYYIAYSGYYTAITSLNMYRDPSFIGNYIVCGVLIGYIAGALNNKSYHFKRMIGAGLTAAIAVGIFQFVLNYTVSFAKAMTTSDPLYALFTTMLPMIILGILAPIVAKVFTWYGIMPGGHY